mmetsp:Transcript_24979/g.69935  ORF Transcript_24979/g.69935 Transcript_24979/m.69935 type:complete len:298 (+) Transcript_24979:570-1463(+)
MEGVTVVHAPGEADAQLADMYERGSVDLVWANDSDLLFIYGIKELLVNVHVSNYTATIQSLDLTKSVVSRVTTSGSSGPHRALFSLGMLPTSFTPPSISSRSRKPAMKSTKRLNKPNPRKPVSWWRSFAALSLSMASKLLKRSFVPSSLAAMASSLATATALSSLLLARASSSARATASATLPSLKVPVRMRRRNDRTSREPPGRVASLERATPSETSMPSSPMCFKHTKASLGKLRARTPIGFKKGARFFPTGTRFPAPRATISPHFGKIHRDRLIPEEASEGLPAPHPAYRNFLA